MRILICLIPAILSAQTAVEHGAATAAGAANSSKSGKTIGNSIGTVLDKVTKTMDTAATRAATPTPASRAAVARAEAAVQTKAPEAKPQPKVDISVIQTGMTRKELIEKAGPPAMSLSGSDGETLWFNGPDGRVPVVLKEGKVDSVGSKQP